MTAKKNAPALKPELKAGDKIPTYGYIVSTSPDGTKAYSYKFAGYELGPDEIFVYSKEEACSLCGIEFCPITKYDFSDETIEEIHKREDRIISCASKIDSSFWTIAFDLYWMNKKKAYFIQSYQNIVTYSEKMFGYGSSTCYSLIAVVDRFAKRNEDGSIIEVPNDLAKDYSVSKLELMVNLTDDQIKQLKPTMSVRQIKKFIKGLEEKPVPALPDNISGDGETKEPEKSPIDSADDNVIDSTAEVVNRNVLLSYKGSGDYEKKSSKICSSISRILKKYPDALIEISYTLP